MIFRTIFEMVLVGFTLWALFHEDKFIAVEQKIVCSLRRRGLKAVPGGKPARTR